MNKKILSKMELKILENAKDGEVLHTSNIVKKIKQYYNFSNSTYARAIKRLEEKGILIPQKDNTMKNYSHFVCFCEEYNLVLVK